MDENHRIYVDAPEEIPEADRKRFEKYLDERIDARLDKAMQRVLRRGPSPLVGGSLVTGSPEEPPSAI